MSLVINIFRDYKIDLYQKYNILFFIIMDSSSSSVSTGTTGPSTNMISSSSLVTPSDSSSILSRTGEETSSWSLPDISLEWVLIIILVLALIGINIFVYLAKGATDIEKLVGPTLANILTWLGITTVNVTKEITDTAATGIKGGVDMVADGIVQGVDLASTSVKNNQDVNEDQGTDGYYIDKRCQKGCPEPESNEANSSLTSNDVASKGGWCYIGEDRGIKSCIEVSEGDKCMSGDIFPSRDVCVNPNLRSS
jgi:hypothetical protein